MAEDDTPIPDSLLPYDVWTQEALRQVIVSAVSHVAREGLPGGHHFYITFKTGFPGVNIPDRLRAQYPDEMTIVLQHQFDRLTMDEAGRSLSVGLSFSGVPATLVIPVAAVTAFADPEVRFGLSFEVEVPERIAFAELPAPEGDDVPARPVEGPAEVVSLDAFRRRPPKD
jgi:hypothetical protein